MRIILIVIIIFTCALTNAQVNLVKNPSFEEYTQCHWAADKITFANYWSGIDTASVMNPWPCVPEYCHVCDTGGGSVPYGGGFYQYPKTGDGMAEVLMFYDESNSIALYRRDYLLGRFHSPLTDGQEYCVSFYVCMEEMANYAIDRIGAFINSGISDTTDSCGMPKTQYTPQIEAGTIISDTFNWVKIEGTYYANGTERFIAIGNFYDLANTTYIPWDVGSAIHCSYYLVDDVSVIPSDLPAYAGPDTWVVLGDSVFIGRTPEIGLECKWYTGGNLVDSGAGIWVHPIVTTTYVVEQTLCGLVKTDTVTVEVWPVGVNAINYAKYVNVYPNPVTSELTIRMAQEIFKSYEVVNSLGQTLLHDHLDGLETKLDVSGLAQGVYYLRLKGDSGREVRRFVKL